MLGTKHVHEFIRQLEKDFTYTIIDSPPLNLVTDAAIMARQVDGVLFVVAEKETGREVAKQALAKFRQAGAPILGVVVNRSGGLHGYYNYKHRYSYRYGEEAPETPLKEVRS